ncbi:MAG TPA: DUF4239 domain-containing protein [Steroidobacteraceae bacterium]|nr:DUF4239 domain-containing protein [Steroidobacteraceae bacterium]
MKFFTDLPIWALFILLLLLTALAMSGPLLIRRRIPFHSLRTNNEVAGFKFATIGVLYAVLLAFVVIIVWERFHDAERALVAESGAAATIYRLSGGLSKEVGAAMRIKLSAYLKSVLEEDWPAMAAGGASPATNNALNAIYAEFVHYRPGDLHDSDLQADLFRQLDQLTQARRERLIMGEGTVPGAIWFVLFLGAVLTVSFTFFFATENVVTQSLMTGVLAALIFSAILVIVAIDRPFTGAVEVSQEPIRLVLDDFRDGDRSP